MNRWLWQRKRKVELWLYARQKNEDGWSVRLLGGRISIGNYWHTVHRACVHRMWITAMSIHSLEDDIPNFSFGFEYRKHVSVPPTEEEANEENTEGPLHPTPHLYNRG